jgi:hypothetical protein
MALRAVKTEEEIRSIPTDQPILIELPGGVIEDDLDLKAKKTEKLEPSDPDAKKLQEQLEAALAAQQTEKARADKSEREATDRIAEANRAAEDARKRTAALEGDVINGGLAAAQSERDSAKSALQTAGEAGDWKAVGEAQSRIGRAEAKILSFESGAAEIAERTEAEKHKTVERKEAPRQPQSFSDAVRSNPDLMQNEKDWMLKNETSFKDADFNKKLDFAYRGAMSSGLVRGSQAYFDHIEKATGLVADNQDDRSTSVQAPPSRNERGSDGRPSSNRITLTPEERDMAKNMGVSEIDYAKQKVRFEEARRADPDKYSSRG